MSNLNVYTVAILCPGEPWYIISYVLKIENPENLRTQLLS